MPMTRNELADHAGRMRDLLEGKRHRLARERLTDADRAALETQIDALIQRVDQLLWDVPLTAAALEFPGMRPGVEPVPGVIAKP